MLKGHADDDIVVWRVLEPLTGMVMTLLMPLLVWIVGVLMRCGCTRSLLPSLSLSGILL